MSPDKCPTCHGTGKCPACGGTGVIASPPPSSHSGPAGANLCANCFGSGKCRDCQARAGVPIQQQSR